MRATIDPKARLFCRNKHSCGTQMNPTRQIRPHSQLRKSFWAALFAWAVLIPVATAEVASTLHDGAEPRALEDGWEYRWGDSPFIDGAPLWAVDSSGGEEWQSIDFPSDPPGREGRTNVWYRIRLPETDAGDSIYVFSIDLSAEVYLDGKKIYHYGEFDDAGRSRFEGWPWHIINLPENYPGKYIYFRIYSDYVDIGLWGEVNIGDERAHIRRIIRREVFPVCSSLALVFCGLALLLCSPLHRRRSLFLMSLFLINLGAIPILESQFKQLLVFAPVTLQFLSAGAYFLLPVSMAALVHAMVGPGPARLIQGIWILHLAYFAIAMALSAGGLVNLSAFYLVFDLLALVTILALSIALSLKCRAGDTEVRILALGFWALYGIMVYNGLAAHGFLPFVARFEYLGPIILGLFFAAAIVHQHTRLSHGLELRTQELETLNANLEKIVTARTRELSEQNKAKDQFFAIIGHDLKAPIATIHHLLQEYEDDGGSVPPDDVTDLREASGRIHQLLESLLTWARGQQGQLSPRKLRFDTHELTDLALAALRAEAHVKNIDIQVAPHPPIALYGDKGMLTTTLRNLMANAIKFTPQGGQVRLTFSEAEGTVRCECSDNGVGISRERLAGLFRPKDHSQIGIGTLGEKGSGLGLLLCQEFIHAHEGEIGATKNDCGGTTLWFTLPSAPPAQLDLL